MILDFETKKVQEISLMDLKDSVDERSSGEPVHGMTHFDLIGNVGQLLHSNGYKIAPTQVYVAGGSASNVTTIKQLEPEFGVNDSRTMLFKRLITSIMIMNHQTDEYNPRIAINYHQRGIQIAFGLNVKVCTNMSILNSENLMSSYGEDKISPSRMLEILSDWINKEKFQANVQAQIRKFEMMKDIMCTYETICEMIGDMTTKRVAKDKFKGGEAILNQSQISNFVESYLEKNMEKEAASLYEVYNYCTDILKPDRSDMPSLLTQNASLIDYFSERYSL